MNLALVNQAFFTLMNKFDRIFDGKNVLISGVVDVVDHRRQGGTLARTGGSRNDYQSTRHIGDLPEYLTHTQLFHWQHFGRDGSKYGRRAPILHKCINPEPGQIWHFEGKVSFHKFFIVFALLVVHDFINQRMNFFAIHLRHVDSTDVSIDPYQWRHTRSNMQVGSALLDAKPQQLCNIHLSYLLP